MNITMKKAVVLVDADNTSYRQLPEILERIRPYADTVDVRCYGDWNSEILKNWPKALSGLDITFVQQSPVGGKNSTDAGILIEGSSYIDCNEYDILCIVSRDRDFVPLIKKAQSKGIFVIGAGYLPVSRELRNSCDEFIVPHKTSASAIISSLKIQWTINAIYSAIDKLGKNGFANLSDIGNYLCYLDPHFTVCSLGKKKLADFIGDYPGILRMYSRINNPLTRTTTVYVGRI